MKHSVAPGQVIGLVGGGQLGRMFTIAARRMGYAVHVLSPKVDDPAAQVANHLTVAEYNDATAIMHLAEVSQVLTYEFEGSDAAALSAAQEITPVYPDPDVLFTFQQRIREKAFLEQNGFPIVRSIPCRNQEEFTSAIAEIGVPAIVKTASGGYDGKGQWQLRTMQEANVARLNFSEHSFILEELLDLSVEISVVIARDVFGSIAVYGPFENAHCNHVLDVTTFPARIDDLAKQQACEIAVSIAEKVKLVGVLCVEFFLDRSGRIVVNEVAPRPHNSGHLTIEAFTCCQFEQQVRAVCGLPVAEARPLSEAAMVNLLGDLWAEAEPDWTAAMSDSSVRLHLYGKTHPQSGRKMGHLTCVAPTVKEAHSRVIKARDLLHQGTCRSQASVTRRRRHNA